MRKKIFILGVGAQKAGTTWLHSQLKQNNNIDLGFLKEYHVFDVTHSNRHKQYQAGRINKLFKLTRAASLERNKADKQELIRRLSFIIDPSSYFDYFDYLHYKNTAIEAVGDITPSYSTLDENAFRFIKEGLEAKGFTLKVVFLMRDPVERIWSQLRMERRNQAQKGKEYNTSQENALRKKYLVPQTSLRTRYDRTIIELEKVFDEQDIYYGFYETLFSNKSYHSLSSFLGINLVTPDFDFKANISPKSETMSYQLQQEIAEHYSETYAFLEKKFGSELVKIWESFSKTDNSHTKP